MTPTPPPTESKGTFPDIPTQPYCLQTEERRSLYPSFIFVAVIKYLDKEKIRRERGLFCLTISGSNLIM